MTFELNGVTYSKTEKGYCYKTTDAMDKKGQPISRRIPASVYNQMYEEFKALEAESNIPEWEEAKEWENASDAELKERMTMKKKSDKEAEKAVNKTNLRKIAKKVAEGVKAFEISNENDDRFGNADDVRAYEERYGWYDEIGTYTEEGIYLNDEELDKIQGMITEETIKLLFPKKRTPKKKDVGYTHSNGLTLTMKQVDFIKHIPDSDFYENGLDSTLWCDVLTDEIGGQFADKPMTVGAMISTLKEKNLINVEIHRMNGKKCKYFEFTELGKEVAKELGLN